jgi:hypothetical protein
MVLKGNLCNDDEVLLQILEFDDGLEGEARDGEHLLTELSGLLLLVL